jgi:hypothetical protein
LPARKATVIGRAAMPNCFRTSIVILVAAMHDHSWNLRRITGRATLAYALSTLIFFLVITGKDHWL